jgi:hypothetical protein
VKEICRLEKDEIRGTSDLVHETEDDCPSPLSRLNFKVCIATCYRLNERTRGRSSAVEEGGFRHFTGGWVCPHPFVCMVVKRNVGLFRIALHTIQLRTSIESPPLIFILSTGRMSVTIFIPVSSYDSFIHSFIHSFTLQWLHSGSSVSQSFVHRC